MAAVVRMTSWRKLNMIANEFERQILRIQRWGEWMNREPLKILALEK
jgi:hypothetical protein